MARADRDWRWHQAFTITVVTKSVSKLERPMVATGTGTVTDTAAGSVRTNAYARMYGVQDVSDTGLGLPWQAAIGIAGASAGRPTIVDSA